NDDFERYLDELLSDPITRRRLLRQGAAGALSASAIAYLAACGDSGGGKAQTKVIPKGQISKTLYFANWPDYIDKKRDSFAKFKKRYGTSIKYVEEINDNDQFFGK